VPESPELHLRAADASIDALAQQVVARLLAT